MLDRTQMNDDCCITCGRSILPDLEIGVIRRLLIGIRCRSCREDALRLRRRLKTGLKERRRNGR